MPTTLVPTDVHEAADWVERVAAYPRLRYMGSKARLVRHLADVFDELGGVTAADPFSGSGIVSYLLKCQGYAVTSSDYLEFPAVIARATTANSDTHLDEESVARILGPNADGRDFISRTFDGLYFTAEDRQFLDSAWSHIDPLRGAQRDIALAALVLSAARRQPRGVFTFTDSTTYADGRWGRCRHPRRRRRSWAGPPSGFGRKACRALLYMSVIRPSPGTHSYPVRRRPPPPSDCPEGRVPHRP